MLSALIDVLAPFCFGGCVSSHSYCFARISLLQVFLFRSFSISFLFCSFLQFLLFLLFYLYGGVSLVFPPAIQYMLQRSFICALRLVNMNAEEVLMAATTINICMRPSRCRRINCDEKTARCVCRVPLGRMWSTTCDHWGWSTAVRELAATKGRRICVESD